MGKNKKFGQFTGSSIERGKKAEEAFMSAWSEKELFPDFVVMVRKATEYEDKKEKTDAVVNVSYLINLEIKIQIKAHHLHVAERNKFLKEGIAPITVRRNHSYKRIRSNTLRSILILLKYKCDGILPKEKSGKRKKHFKH